MAQENVTRPPITGIARVQIYVTNTAQASDFYEKLLGFGAMPDCDNGIAACLAVKSRQQIQLLAAPSPLPQNLIAKVTFATPDVDQMRAYLISRGYAPNAISQSEDGKKSITLHDPEGHAIGFVQLAPPSVFTLQPTQVSPRLIHAGFIVHDRQAEDRFYKDILGFHLYWQGGMKDSETSWASMQVPDGTDWLEYMLNVAPDANVRVIGIMNHLALGVSDIQAAKRQFVNNGGKPGEEPKLGRDGKWQLNLYGPDGTRVEIMEFQPKEKPCCSPFTGEHPIP